MPWWNPKPTEDWDEEEVKEVDEGKKESTSVPTDDGGSLRYSQHPTGGFMVEVVPPSKESEK